MAAQLVAAGFEVVATPVPTTQLYGSVLPAGAFDLALVPVDSGAYPSALGSVFSTSPAIAGGGTVSGLVGVRRPQDRHTVHPGGAGAGSAVSAQAIYQQIDQELWTAMPTLPLFAEPTLLVWSSSLSGVVDDPGESDRCGTCGCGPCDAAAHRAKGHVRGTRTSATRRARVLDALKRAHTVGVAE